MTAVPQIPLPLLRTGAPCPHLHACITLIAQVLAVSSAATVFSLMAEVPALMLAAWRLQLTSVVLAAGAAWQWRGMVGLFILLALFSEDGLLPAPCC